MTTSRSPLLSKSGFESLSKDKNLILIFVEPVENYNVIKMRSTAGALHPGTLPNLKRLPHAVILQQWKKPFLGINLFSTTIERNVCLQGVCYTIPDP